jgi:hypothetical protein
MADSFVIGTLFALPISAETPIGSQVYTVDGSPAFLDRIENGGVTAVLSNGSRGNIAEFIEKYERCCVDPLCVSHFAKYVRVRELLDPKDSEDEGELLRCDSCTEPLVEVWAERGELEPDGDGEESDADPKDEAVGPTDGGGEFGVGSVAPVEVEG